MLLASVLKKQHDPQWRLPFWGSDERAAIMVTEEDAAEYFKATIGRE